MHLYSFSRADQISQYGKEQQPTTNKHDTHLITTTNATTTALCTPPHHPTTQSTGYYAVRLDGELYGLLNNRSAILAAVDDTKAAIRFVRSVASDTIYVYNCTHHRTAAYNCAMLTVLVLCTANERLKPKTHVQR